MLKTVAGTSLALTVAILVLTAAVVLGRGGSAGEAAAWAVGLALGTRVVPILGSFVIAWWPRSGQRVPPLGALGVLRILAAESWATVRLFFYYHPFESLVTRREPDHVVPGEVPLVLVHGFYSNAGFWHSMKPALRAAGWNNIFTLNLDPLFIGIDDYARQLAQRVEAASRRCGTDSAILVGHSMGGLVARVCARRIPGRIRHVVCIGSPHHGTVPASLVPSLTTRQMRPGSDWLAGLNRGDPDGIVTNLYSEHDNIIVPQHSATLPGAENIALRAIGHLEMAFSPALRQALIDVLQQIRA
ncbi:MAG: alpha/beta fold hydrolase [Gammaproteobacteria bacterium]|nr:alpha/beta fold hydrolase [Gammaproteobacteria bacterium]